MSPSRDESTGGLERPLDRHRIVRSTKFRKSLEALGASDQVRVVAGLAEFEKDWVGGRPIEEMRNQWHFKPPKVRDNCKRAHLHQFRPTRHTRAWMAPDPDPKQKRMILLHVIRKKTVAEENRVIDWLCKMLCREKG